MAKYPISNNATQAALKRDGRGVICGVRSASCFSHLILRHSSFFLLMINLLATHAGGADTPVFEKDVLPIFTRHCFNCHGKSSPQLGLDLRSARLTMRGSQNGPVIVPGAPEESLLWKKVSTREMPLELFALKLSDAEIDTIRQWIAAGAPSEPAALPPDVQAQFAHFKNEVRPILVERCVECHGGSDPEADLDLRSLESLVRGSQSGPVIVEGFSDKSVLIRKVSSHAMPPPDSGEPLTSSEIRTITQWIDRGRFADFVDVDRRLKGEATATVTDEDRRFWAFQQPVAAPLPAVRATDRIRTPIDRFILAKLETHELTFSAAAAKLTLHRRLCFDLTGLPPTPLQAQEFLADPAPDAYERLIDRLLTSPHHGERWGRHWLDSVGYVDTSNKDFAPETVALSDGYWRYRDYVIASTNADIPWNRFLVEQIAGDELVDWRNAEQYTPEMRKLLTATGYLRNVLDATDEDISNLPFDRYEALFKLMERVSSSTLGLTLACARCHSHKFDPIPQTDYYRFLSLFTAAYNPSDWLPPKQRFLYDVSQPEQKRIEHERATTNSTLDGLKQQVSELLNRYRSRLLEEKVQAIPAAIRADAKAAVETPAKERSEAQNKLAATYEKQLTITDAQVDAALSQDDREIIHNFRAQTAMAERHLATLKMGKVQALWDVGQAPTIRLLHRGDVDFAGPVVEPGFLTVLSQPGQSDATTSTNAVGPTTGLRLAFAEWLTSPEHPLAGRVIVNRIWQHHFGNGIVTTPGNFGENGSRPTHPILLDWLAVEFQRQRWSAKQLHRMIVTSSAYRQVSSRAAASTAQAVDPDNRLVWRMNLRRLDAESLRDAVITVSGQRNSEIGGPPVMLKATSDGMQRIPDQQRRSIYLLARRSNPASFLRVFDYPVIDVNCTRRASSTTPLQSLTMVNSEFLIASASQLALRIENLVGENAPLTSKIEMAYWLTLSRGPSELELNAAEEHLKNLVALYTQASGANTESPNAPFSNLVHMLLCTNEFLYVD